MQSNQFYKKNNFQNEENLVKIKKIRVPRFARGTIFGLDLEELEDFFREIKYSQDSNAKRDFLMFKIIFFHGLRRQECANLKIEDLLWHKNGDSKKDRIYIKAVKGGREGKELIHPVERDLILEYLKIRKEDGSDLLFTSQKKEEKGISVFAISNAYKKYAKLAKLPIEKQHVHCLRHTFAFQMIENDATLEQVMIGLRQMSLQSAMKYFRKSEKIMHKVQANFFENVS